MPLVEGALQPVGTVRVTAPFSIPPLAALYVKTTVLPLELWATVVVGVVIVPEPSAAYTLTRSEEARAVSAPAATDFCLARQVVVPTVEPTVAPGPPAALEP